MGGGGGLLPVGSGVESVLYTLPIAQYIEFR